MNIVFDLEVYPNCFTLAAEHAEFPVKWAFEISEFQDDTQQLIEWLIWLKSHGAKMIGFNNVGFDYPILHLLVKYGKVTPELLHDKCVAIIASQDENRWQHMVYPSDRYIDQIDLYLIHHFDNKARATSLKALEFNMRMDSLQDLPFPPNTVLNQEQIKLLKQYNAHDVHATKLFYQKSLEQIKLRGLLC